MRARWLVALCLLGLVWTAACMKSSPKEQGKEEVVAGDQVVDSFKTPRSEGDEDLEEEEGRVSQIASGGAKAQPTLNAASRKPPPPGGVWAVEPFDEKKDWMPAELSEDLAGVEWGKQLSQKLVERLVGRDIEAEASGKKLTKEDVAELVQTRNLKFVVGGTLDSLAAKTNGSRTTATLVVVYNVRKRLDDKPEVSYVEARPLSTSHTFDAKKLGRTEMDQLLDATATELAKKIVVSIPTDVIAEKG